MLFNCYTFFLHYSAFTPVLLRLSKNYTPKENPPLSFAPARRLAPKSRTTVAKLALTAPQPAPANWERWPQHHPNNDYPMIDSGMLPYDSRPGGPDPLHRPMVPSHQFFSNPPYNPAPLTSMATSGYQQQQQQQQAAFTTYGSFPSSLTTMVSPFKPPSLERPQLPLGPMSKPEGAGGYEYPKDRRSSYVSGSPSPSVKSEAQMSSARSVASSRSSVARTITSNAPVGNATQIDFNTSVDALMKAIQSKDETETIVKKVEAQQMPQVPVARSPEQVCHLLPAVYSQGNRSLIGSQEQPEGGRANRKRYQCDIAGCTRAFYQKTHLEIHRRAHTGDKPYVCDSDPCG